MYVSSNSSVSSRYSRSQDREGSGVDEKGRGTEATDPTACSRSKGRLTRLTHSSHTQAHSLREPNLTQNALQTLVSTRRLLTRSRKNERENERGVERQQQHRRRKAVVSITNRFGNIGNGSVDIGRGGERKHGNGNANNNRGGERRRRKSTSGGRSFEIEPPSTTVCDLVRFLRSFHVHYRRMSFFLRRID